MPMPAKSKMIWMIQITGALLLLAMFAAHYHVQNASDGANEIISESLSDYDLLCRVAAGDTGWAKKVLAGRVADYNESEVAAFVENVVDIAVLQRPEFSARIEFVVTCNEVLSDEWGAYAHEEANRRQWAHAEPVIRYVNKQFKAPAPRPIADLELLRSYYIALENPDVYPVLHPRTNMNCFGEPTARELLRKIAQVFRGSGKPGAGILEAIGVGEP